MTNRRLTSRQKRQQTNELDYTINKKFDMKQIKPMTANQEKLQTEYLEGQNLVNIGSAGTGKTYFSLALALKTVLEEKSCFNRIIIIRSAVQSRDQGFMPGSLTEKMAYYETPYMDIVNDLFGRGDAYSILKQKNTIQFMSTSFMRGLTFDNAIILLDEFQNNSYEEIRTVITRVGENSKIIFCGDTRQDDLRNGKNRLDRSGLENFLTVAKEMNRFSIIKFTTSDIVRSGLVKEFIIKEEKHLEYN